MKSCCICYTEIFGLFAFRCTSENGLEYHHINLTIFEVQQEFFNIPFVCHILSSFDYDNGTVNLIECELLHTLSNFTSHMPV